VSVNLEDASFEGEGGTFQVADRLEIAGEVRYYGEALTSVPGVNLQLGEGEGAPAAETGADGAFAFEQVKPGDYALAPSRSVSASDPSGGITSLDLVLIRRAILDLQPLSGPMARLAGDANASESITSLDIVLLRRIILSLAEELPGAESFWRFVPSGHEFSDPQVPFGAPAARSYSGLSTSKNGQDFAAVKRGDVNASWSPPSSSSTAAATAGAGSSAESGSAESGGAETSSGGGPGGRAVRLAAASGEASVGDTVRAPLKVREGTGVAALQYTVQWDPGRLSLLRTGDYGLPGMGPGHLGTEHAQEGRLPVVWSDPKGRSRSLPEGEPAMALWFEVKKAGAADIGFTSDPTPSRAYGGEELMAVSIQKEGGTIRARERPESYRFDPPAPNPARSRATVEYGLPEASRVRVTVYDFLGREVARPVAKRQPAGRHTVAVDVSDLSSGAYLVRFEARSGSESVTRTHKVIVAR
jgi:hypothetical protein